MTQEEFLSWYFFWFVLIPEIPVVISLLTVVSNINKGK